MTLTRAQIDLLNRHLKFYRQLDLGSKQPNTSLQKQFVDVCRGHAVSRTDHEKAYMAFKAEEAQKNAEKKRKEAAKTERNRQERENRTRLHARIKKNAEIKKAGEVQKNAEKARKEAAKSERNRQERENRARIHARVKKNTGRHQKSLKKAPLSKADPREPKPWARFISEPLGTRNDFKRDSGRNWSDAKKPKN